MEFEWDEAKSAANLAKHRISFETAVGAFGGPLLRRNDTRFDYGEERWLALGEIDNVVIAIAYTMRGESIRVISARKANRNERQAYENYRG
jgi:hypothetical protein